MIIHVPHDKSLGQNVNGKNTLQSNEAQVDICKLRSNDPYSLNFAEYKSFFNKNGQILMVLGP